MSSAAPLLGLILVLAAACGDGASTDRRATASATGAPAPAASTGITIRMGPDGRSQVDGAPAPTGSPAACAALRACCSPPQVSLFCSLGQATGDSCEQQLSAVQAHLTETKTAKPAGCP